MNTVSNSFQGKSGTVDLSAESPLTTLESLASKRRHSVIYCDGERTGVSTDAAVKWYIANGATASKITMGRSRHNNLLDRVVH